MFKDILIVEDNHNHSTDACRAVISHDRNVEFHVANCLRGAMIVIDNLKDSAGFAVLADLYFPADLNEDTRAPSSDGYVMQPLGMLIMAECMKRKIPCVIVTAGYHHGQKYNEICVATRVLGWPNMIDNSDSSEPDAESPKKDWNGGLKKLIEISASYRA